jgi:ubiquinol-cytochrome c reductase cytochrome c subunit
MARTLGVTAACALLLAASASAAERASSAARGRQVYMTVGCWECHGTVGQGSFAGLKLAPEPLPAEALIAFVRGTTGPMPAYSEAVLSDAALADIHAYLASQPKAASPDAIPALKDLKPGKAR